MIEIVGVPVKPSTLTFARQQEYREGDLIGLGRFQLAQAVANFYLP